MRLLAEEAAADKSSGCGEKAVFRVCEKLRGTLATLMGVAGFRSLLARALGLASEEVAWLKEARVESDGSLKGLAETDGQVLSAEIVNGEIVLIAHLLGLLVIFIGEALTLRLVQEAWPKASFEKVGIGNGKQP